MFLMEPLFMSCSRRRYFWVLFFSIAPYLLHTISNNQQIRSKYYVTNSPPFIMIHNYVKVKISIQFYRLPTSTMTNGMRFGDAETLIKKNPSIVLVFLLQSSTSLFIFLCCLMVFWGLFLFAFIFHTLSKVPMS